MSAIAPLRDFVTQFTAVHDRYSDPSEIQAEGARLLRTLIAQDGWLPEVFALPDPAGYRQYLLHADPAERFSVVSFVWGPGQKTPLHDHRVGGLIGQLRGRERETQFTRDAEGRFVEVGSSVLEKGEVAILTGANDYHQVANDEPDRPSISIHIYGANIGGVARATFDPQTGAEKRFVSGYSNDVVPNLWDRSHEEVAS